MQRVNLGTRLNFVLKLTAGSTSQKANFGRFDIKDFIAAWSHRDKSSPKKLQAQTFEILQEIDILQEII